MSVDSGIVPTATVGLNTVARTYEISVRMAQAYAAGVGDWNPAYFHDESPGGLLAPPCLVYALQWNARAMPGLPQGTAPPAMSVHATTDLRFERPIRVADVLTVQGTCIAVCQRRPGVYVVTRFEVRDSTGALVATVDDGAIVRGARTDGADVSLADTPSLLTPTGNETDGWRTALPIAKEAAHVYTECANIWNPIHTERRVALEAGLPGTILQGSATMALAARELTNRVTEGDPSRLVRLAGQFRAMIKPGSEIQVVCSGVSCSSPPQRASSPDAEAEKVAFFEVLNAEGQTAVKGGVAVFRA